MSAHYGGDNGGKAEEMGAEFDEAVIGAEFDALGFADGGTVRGFEEEGGEGGGGGGGGGGGRGKVKFMTYQERKVWKAEKRERDWSSRSILRNRCC